MSFFDSFTTKTNHNEEKSKQVMADHNEKVAQPLNRQFDCEPDAPFPFGYKTAWLAVKDVSPEEVIRCLKLKNVQVVNWKSGVVASYDDKLFVTPLMDHYVIVAGVLDLTEKQEKLDEIAKMFEEVLFFATHRTVELCMWAKYNNGARIRSYYYLGESGAVKSEGELTGEEMELGFDSFPISEDYDWDWVEFPDEESVLEISKAWGVDTGFEGHENELSTGYLADKEVL